MFIIKVMSSKIFTDCYGFKMIIIKVKNGADI